MQVNVDPRCIAYLKNETQGPPTAEEPETAGVADLLRLLGEIEDARVLEILALSPTVTDVEIAAMWAEGQGDVPDRAGQSLEGTAAQIYEIVTRDEETPERQGIHGNPG